MTENPQEQDEARGFLPLGSVVILKGSVKKLLIVSRGSIVEGDFFDYGAFMYPEGMIDTNIAYFNHDDILKIVHEGYTDDDNDLVLEILNSAFVQFQQRDEGDVSSPEPAAAAPIALSVRDVDPFASVRDLADGDE